MAGLTSVVVVSHDSGETLGECVRRVLAQDAPVELIVVDNGSRDGAADALPGDPRLQLLRQPGNPGFAVACNCGAARARGDTLLFLNPDCLLPADALSRLHAALPDGAAPRLLGARLLNADGSPQAASERSTPTPQRMLTAGWGRSPWRGDAAAPSPDTHAVEAISGALMLIPRAEFERLGGFDEGYRLHCEDLDLCRRVLLAGGWVGLAEGVRVTHLKGTSSRRRPLWVEWQKHRGMLRYFRKFDAAASPRWLRLMVPLAIAARFPLAAARAWWRSRNGID